MVREAIWMLRRSTSGVLSAIRSFPAACFAWRKFWRNYGEYSRMAPLEGQPQLRDLYPCIHDDVTETPIEPVYFYQDAWAFEKIVKRGPPRHVDVGSHHKFVALLSKVVPLTMVDIRPLSLPVDTVHFKEGSILALPFEDQSVVSLSSLCVVEHIGLGRYGDPLDPQGTEKAIMELCRVLAPSGHLYLSLPVGDRDITAFNAGRVLRLERIREIISPLAIIEERFIVGRSFQKEYQHTWAFGTTGLFEVVRNK